MAKIYQMAIEIPNDWVRKFDEFESHVAALSGGSAEVNVLFQPLLGVGSATWEVVVTSPNRLDDALRAIRDYGFEITEGPLEEEIPDDPEGQAAFWEKRNQSRAVLNEFGGDLDKIADKVPGFAENCFAAAIVPKRPLDKLLPRPVVRPTGQRSRRFCNILFRIISLTECKELHYFARKVFIGMLLAALSLIEPDEHRRIFCDFD